MKARRLVLCAVALLALAAIAVVPTAMGAKPTKPGRGGGGNTGGGDVPAQCRRYPEGSRQRDRCVQIIEHRQAAGGGAVTISALKLTPSTFKANPTASAPITADATKGTAVTFNLSTAARVAFRVIRKVPNGGRKVNRKCKAKTRANASRPKCTLERPAGSFPYDGVAGANTFRFAGWASRALKPGKYRLQGSPTANSKSVAKANFKVTK